MHKAVVPAMAAGLALSSCETQPDVSGVADAPAYSVEEVSADQLKSLIDTGNVRLIDVRTDEEVEDGVIPGAEHIALDEFNPAKIDMSDGREIVLYCRSDRRSGVAAEQLAEYTGKTARHLDGGILAWEEAGYPLAGD